MPVRLSWLLGGCAERLQHLSVVLCVHCVVFDVVCVEEVLFALTDKLLELWALNLFLAELTVIAFIDAALLFGLFLFFVFVAFLCYFINKLKSIQQDVLFPLAELLVGSDVALRLGLNLLDLPQVDLLLQRGQFLRQAYFARGN